MYYEIIDEYNAVVFAQDINAIYKTASDLGYNYTKTMCDYIPHLNIVNSNDDAINFMLIKIGEGESFEEQPNFPVEETEEKVPDLSKEMVSQYQQGAQYARRALTDIINEFKNEILLRELIINNFKEGKSVFDLGSGVIQPLIPKAQKGKVQKPFTPYGKGSKKYVKDFLKEDSEDQQTLDAVDRYFQKMQRGLSKHDKGGLGISTEEEANLLLEEISLFETGIEYLTRLKIILKTQSPAATYNLLGANGLSYQEFLNKLFTVANTAYMIFAEQKYEYRDDVSSYLQITTDKARTFIEEFRSLIQFFESITYGI